MAEKLVRAAVVRPFDTPLLQPVMLERDPLKVTSVLCIFTTMENQIVLSDAAESLDPDMNPSDTLKQDVSLFLRSLQHFPHLLPLPFPLETYKAFFALVSAWRNGEFSASSRSSDFDGSTAL